MSRDNHDNVIALLATFKHYGETATGGLTRLVYDAHWLQAQQAFIVQAKAYGLTCFIDPMGTVYATTPTRNADEPVILTGSHMDTVINGGGLDGQYGVLASLVAVGELLAQYGPPQKPLGVVAFSEEEGSRFPTTFSGSRWLTQQFNGQDNKLRDTQGVTFDAARQQAVAQLATLVPMRTTPIALAAYLELHIEQGNILNARGDELGLVTAIVGQRRLAITLTGVSNHAGTTPMIGRVDAVAQAVALMHELYQQLPKFDGLRHTIGQIMVSPNTANVIADAVQFSLDIRHAQQALLDEVTRFVMAQVAAGGGKACLTTDISATPLSSVLLEKAAQTAAQQHVRVHKMISGAGHDAQVIAQSGVPVALLFVPSDQGISHAPAEATADQQLIQGQAILQALLYQLGYQSS